MCVFKKGEANGQDMWQIMLTGLHHTLYT